MIQGRQVHVYRVDDATVHFGSADNEVELHFLAADESSIIVVMPMELLETLQVDIDAALRNRPAATPHR